VVVAAADPERGCAAGRLPISHPPSCASPGRTSRGTAWGERGCTPTSVEDGAVMKNGDLPEGKSSLKSCVEVPREQPRGDDRAIDVRSRRASSRRARRRLHWPSVFALRGADSAEAVWTEGASHTNLQGGSRGATWFTSASTHAGGGSASITNLGRQRPRPGPRN